jgi:hypothetical protein
MSEDSSAGGASPASATALRKASILSIGGGAPVKTVAAGPCW